MSELPVNAAEGQSDGELVRAAIAGSQAAFGQLYERFSRPVHGVLLARLTPADADDVLQDVFLHGWKHLRQLRDRDAFGPWICAIARRRAIDSLRRARPHEELPEDLPAAGEAETRFEAGRALAAIRALPEAYRETLLLRLVEGLSGEEIARVTGLRPDSVRVNLCRGFKLLRERVGNAP